GAARQHLDHATDLLVAADDGIELPLLSHLGEIARVPLERLVLVLGILVLHAVRAAHGLERFAQRVRGRTGLAEYRAALGALGFRQREEEMLSGDVLVAERLGLGLGAIEDLIQLARHGWLPATALFRVARHFARDALADRRHVRAGLLQDWNNDALVLFEQRGEQVKIVDERIAVLAR